MDAGAELTPEATTAIDEIAARYLWWGGDASLPHATDRAIAQVMNLGTYSDILGLEVSCLLRYWPAS